MKLKKLALLLPILGCLTATAAVADAIAEESFDYSTHGGFWSSLNKQGGKEDGWGGKWSGDKWYFDVADPTHKDNPNNLREAPMQVGDVYGGDRAALLSGYRYGDHYDTTRLLDSHVGDDDVYVRFLMRWDWGEMNDGDAAYLSLAKNNSGHDALSAGISINGEGDSDFFVELGGKKAFVDYDIYKDPFADYAFEMHLLKDGEGDYSGTVLSVFKGEDAEYVGSAELFDIDVNFTKIDRVRMETENLYYDTNLRDGDESDYVFFDEVFLADSYGEISVGGDYGDMGAIPEPTSSALILAAGTVLFVTTGFLRRKAGSHNADQD